MPSPRLVNAPRADALWIFGYGSLIYRPGFRFEERVVGYIRGYARRFWQESLDHRGTPERPGRVVTLIEEPMARCWGAAYRIPRDEEVEVLGALELREKCGYARVELSFFRGDALERATQETKTMRVTVFIGNSSNPHFIGPEDDICTASIIRASQGPSGHNADYVFDLDNALRELGTYDSHVSQIAHLLRKPAPQKNQ